MLNVKNQMRKVALNAIHKMPWRCQDSLYYFHRFKRLPHIQHPKSFNEKVLFRKFVNGDYARYAMLSDKILVREHVAKKIGEQYLIPLLHTTDDPTTLLGMESLKDAVIKPNHGSGMVKVFVDEPNFVQKKKLIARCEEWLSRDYSFEAREIHYRYIKPQILVEKRIGDDKSTAIDYKFHMFNKGNGHFEYVLQVVYNRCDNEPLSMLFYVNNLDSCFYKRFDTGLDISDKRAPLEKALTLSKELASDFDYVRVDWYISGEEVWFGELTFTPGAGLMPVLQHGLDQVMGNMWLQHEQAATLIASCTARKSRKSLKD